MSQSFSKHVSGVRSGNPPGPRRSGPPAGSDRPGRRASDRTGVLVFLLLAFGVSWSGLLVAHQLGFSAANIVVQLVTVAYAPAIAALVVRRWVTREGFADSGLRPRFRANLRFYLLAWLAPYGFTVGSAAVAVLAGLWQPEPDLLVRPTELGLPLWALLLIMLVVVPLLTPIYWGEEFGWTSYLRMRLLPRRPMLATLGTGLIWAVWHYPLAFVGYVEYGNVVTGLASWTVMFVAMEVILSWVWLRSGTVWTAGLAHAGNNMVISLLAEMALWEVDGGVDPGTGQLLTAAPMIVVAVVILLSGVRGEGHGLNAGGQQQPDGRQSPSRKPGGDGSSPNDGDPHPGGTTAAPPRDAVRAQRSSASASSST